MAVSAMVCCVVSQSCPSPADLLTVNLTAVLATVGIMMGFVMFSLFFINFSFSVPCNGFCILT